MPIKIYCKCSFFSIKWFYKSGEIAMPNNCADIVKIVFDKLLYI